MASACLVCAELLGDLRTGIVTPIGEEASLPRSAPVVSWASAVMAVVVFGTYTNVTSLQVCRGCRRLVHSKRCILLVLLCALLPAACAAAESLYLSEHPATERAMITEHDHGMWSLNVHASCAVQGEESGREFLTGLLLNHSQVLEQGQVWQLFTALLASCSPLQLAASLWGLLTVAAEAEALLGYVWRREGGDLRVTAREVSHARLSSQQTGRCKPHPTLQATLASALLLLRDAGISRQDADTLLRDLPQQCFFAAGTRPTLPSSFWRAGQAR